MYTQIVICKP